MRFLLPFIVFLALLPTRPSWADGSISSQVTAVKLYRSNAIIAASDPKHAKYVENFTPEACRALLDQKWKEEAATRTTGTVTYKCAIEERTGIKFQQPVACPDPPPNQTRSGTCPAGTQGSWTQTGTTTYGTAPACAPTVTWRPVMPPEGACTPIAPAELPAPTGVTATPESTSVILVRWNVVPDAVAYSLRRCIGANCSSLTQLLCVQGLQQRHVTLGAGVTVRYQVAASRDANCGQVGALSGIINATTFTTTPEPEPEGPPTACTGRVCRVSWSHDGPAAEGFRIVYGRNENELTQVAQVTPGNVRNYELTMPATGVWYFGVLAFAGGNTSAISNIVVRTVQ